MFHFPIICGLNAITILRIILFFWTPCIYKHCDVSTEKSSSDSFQTERNMIGVTMFFLDLNQIEFRLIHKQKEKCHYDHILLWIRKEHLCVWACSVFKQQFPDLHSIGHQLPDQTLLNCIHYSLYGCMMYIICYYNINLI